MEPKRPHASWLHAARKQFRQTALEILAELTLDETDFAAEAMAVYFGIDVREPIR